MPVNVLGEEGVPRNNADRGLSAGEQLCRKAPEAVADSKLSMRKKYLGKKKRGLTPSGLHWWEHS